MECFQGEKGNVVCQIETADEHVEYRPGVDNVMFMFSLKTP